MPDQSFNIVHFEKLHGRICPVLRVEDCIALELCSTECVEPGNLVLTFEPESLEVEHTRLRGQLQDDGRLDNSLKDIGSSSDILGQPENKVNLERVGSGFLHDGVDGQITGLECKTSANTAFPDSQDSSNTLAQSSSSNASPDISLTAYLNKLVKLAQS